MDGWIILDKESGLYSRTAGAKLARMFGANTAGHIGTLDPMATGLLPIAIGDARKMIPFWPENEVKEYLFGVQFGFETDTLDITGTKVQSSKCKVQITEEQIRDACAQLIGDIDQIPPQYSAIHVNGRRGYELARAGKSVEMKPRPVTIYELDFTGITDGSYQFRVVCSPGTYVRSIARDIAKLCGTVATVDMIRRVRTNGLEIKDAVKLDFLENLVNNGASVQEFLMPADFGLGDIPVWNLDDKDAASYENGGFIEMAQCGSGSVRVYNNNRFIGIGRMDGNLLKPKRMLKQKEM